MNLLEFMVRSIKPQSEKQEKIASAVEEFLNSDAELVLPTIGGGRFDYHMRDISIAVDVFYDEMDKAIEMMGEEAERVNKPISCSKGCSHCCYQPVSCNIAEAILIVNHLNENGDTREHFNSKYKAWRRNMDAPGYSKLIAEEVQASVRGERNKPSKLMGFVRDNWTECPFLKDDCCSIYSARPSPCRAHLSLDDPEKCKTANIAMMAAGKTLDKLLFEKQGPLFIALTRSLGIDAIANFPMPLGVYEISKGGKDYIKLVASQAKENYIKP